ncbi:MAG: CAP domain-containing protein [Solirubrobacteraceae bacterium]
MTRKSALLSPAALACLALALPIPVPAAASAGASCSGATLVPDRANMARVRTATLCLLNAERGKRGLAPLSSHRQLRKAAQAYSANMVRQRFFAHVSPQGTTLRSRVSRTSYLRGRLSSWSLGENLAWGSGDRATPKRIVRSWMHSPGHRDNILDPSFRDIGIGVVIGAPDDVGGRPAATYTTDFGHRVAR